jgi:hypothetical protein
MILFFFEGPVNDSRTMESSACCRFQRPLLELIGITQLCDHKGIKFGLAEVDNFMTEKIKKALKVWAEKVLEDKAHWDTNETHQMIQKLYELSVCQKILIGESNSSSGLWKRQQAELSIVLESLTGPSKKNKIINKRSLKFLP